MTLRPPSCAMKAWLLTGALLAAPATAAADASLPFYERSVVVEADARCRLFAPAVSTALKAARAQARGAALRAGRDGAALAEAAARARAQAASVACTDPSLGVIKQRVEHAFSGWTRLAAMRFPGATNAWSATRTLYKSEGWRLVQETRVRDAIVTFGVAGGLTSPERLTAVVSFPGRSRPYAARIVMRDEARNAQAWPNALPPAAFQRAVWSGGYDQAPAGLLAEGRKAGEAWVFPAESLRALERLDPRERFAVEFVFRDDTVASAEFEAGDLSAATAFLAMGSL